jgi:putative effector of murein hydrolase
MNTSEAAALIGSLLTAPTAWLAISVAVWCAADALAEATGRHALANPVLISILAVALLLKVTDTDYRTYFSGVSLIQFLIGPAIVSIAVPLFKHWPTLKRNVFPIVIALIAGSITAITSATLMARAFGLPVAVTISLAPKSATTGAAMGISQNLGGDPAMTATFTVTTSIIAAIALVSLMRLLRVRDPAVTGFAVGLTGHSVGTARAFQINPVAGTFAGIALCLNAIMTSVITPILLPLLTP